MLPRDDAIRSPITVAAGAAAARLADYAALAKLRLTLLVLAATAAGFLLASPQRVDWALLLHTLAGTALVGGGAAALNQVIERRLDAAMKRTCGRPIPAGRMSVDEALYFGVGLSVGGTLYLLVAANVLTAALAAATLGLYLAVYTPLKRVTPLCLAAGAVPGAMPPLIGFAAAHASLTYAAFLPALIVYFWQHPHFLAISWMYRDDYARAGFAMSAVTDPDGRATARQAFIRTIALVLVSLIPAAARQAGPAYALAALALGAVLIGFAAAMSARRDFASARRLFLASIVYLPLLLTLLILDGSGG